MVVLMVRDRSRGRDVVLVVLVLGCRSWHVLSLRLLLAAPMSLMRRSPSGSHLKKS